MPVKPPTVVTAEWAGDLAFTVRAGDHAIVTDGDARQGVVAGAVAGRRAGRVHGHRRRAHPDARPPAAQALTVSLSARRAEDDPHRVVGVQIHFAVGGDVNPAQLDRAVQLSRDKYCSVWHSMREDITLETTTSIDPAA